MSLLDQFIYEDHYGRQFRGLEQGVFLNESELRDYSWNYDTINSRISRFYQGVTKRSIPLVFACESDETIVAVRNRLLELTETDVEARIPGKIRIGDYYTTGFITGSKKSKYLLNKRYCEVDLTLTSEDPTWYRETTHYFTVGDTESTTDGGIDYPYDYTYDYVERMTGRSIYCDSVGDNAFRMTIYGVTTNPTIIVGNHTYKLNGNIGSGERVVIDGLNKTIVLTSSNGVKTNWFDKRDRNNYIFEPIPSGTHAVAYSGSFSFELTIIEKRREPKWT